LWGPYERVDGRGYPEGITGEKIPELARIISVVDAFEAMTSNRAYRKALPWKKAADILAQGSETQWQSDLVKKCIKIVTDNGFENIQKDVKARYVRPD